jgi:hypothetical protein
MAIEKYRAEFKNYGEISDGVIVCPHCFQVEEDGWEYGLRDGCSTEVRCGGCDQLFRVQCSISVDYTTKKIGTFDAS